MTIFLQTRSCNKILSFHDSKLCFGFLFIYKVVPQFRPTMQTESKPKGFLLLSLAFTSINLCNHNSYFPSRCPCAGCSTDSRVQHIELSSSYQRPQCWACHWRQLPTWVNHELPQLGQARSSVKLKYLTEAVFAPYTLTNISISTMQLKRLITRRWLKCQLKHEPEDMKRVPKSTSMYPGSEQGCQLWLPRRSWK